MKTLPGRQTSCRVSKEKKKGTSSEHHPRDGTQRAHRVVLVIPRATGTMRYVPVRSAPTMEQYNWETLRIIPYYVEHAYALSLDGIFRMAYFSGRQAVGEDMCHYEACGMAFVPPRLHGQSSDLEKVRINRGLAVWH